MKSINFNITYFIIFLFLLITEISIALFLSTGFIRQTFGDFLVVILLYCFIKSFINIKPVYASTIVLVIALLVELSQFFSLIEILNLEQNTITKLILGTTFQVTDLIAYTLGIITVILIEYKINK